MIDPDGKQTDIQNRQNSNYQLHKELKIWWNISKDISKSLHKASEKTGQIALKWGISKLTQRLIVATGLDLLIAPELAPIVVAVVVTFEVINDDETSKFFESPKQQNDKQLKDEIENKITKEEKETKQMMENYKLDKRYNKFKPSMSAYY